MSLLETLDRLERGMTRALHVWRWWVAGAVSILYLATTGVLAHYKLFWNDELFTVYISRLPVSDIWRFLETGVEQVPPTFHVLTRIVVGLFGEHHVALRVPSILGVGAMSLCLFAIVSRRTSTPYGVVAMVVPLVTQTYFYAYEARPYGLVLAFSAGSLLCWQSAADGRRRALSLAGLTATLAAALASHYYAILVFLPLAAGEIVRSARRRRLDPAIWLAFCLATTPLLAFLPLIQAGRRHATTFWAPPQWQMMIVFYQNVLGPAAVPLLAIILILAFYAIVRSSVPLERTAVTMAAPPLHEVIAALGYLAIPAIATVLAKVVTGALTDRYALPAVLGLALIVPWGAYHLLDGRATMGAVMAVLLCGWFVAIVGFQSVIRLREEPLANEAVYRFLRMAAPGNEPIVIPSPHTFFKLTYYAPPDLSSRLLYLADRAAALHHLRTDTPEVGIHEFRRWTALRIEDYRHYLSAHPRFLLYADRGPWAWLVPALAATNARFHPLALDGPAPLFLVETQPNTPTNTMRAPRDRHPGARRP